MIEGFFQHYLLYKIRNFSYYFLIDWNIISQCILIIHLIFWINKMYLSTNIWNLKYYRSLECSLWPLQRHLCRGELVSIYHSQNFKFLRSTLKYILKAYYCRKNIYSIIISLKLIMIYKQYATFCWKFKKLLYCLTGHLICS